MAVNSYPETRVRKLFTIVSMIITYSVFWYLIQFVREFRSIPPLDPISFTAIITIYYFLPISFTAAIADKERLQKGKLSYMRLMQKGRWYFLVFFPVTYYMFLHPFFFYSIRFTLESQIYFLLLLILLTYVLGVLVSFIAAVLVLPSKKNKYIVDLPQSPQKKAKNRGIRAKERILVIIISIFWLVFGPVHYDGWSMRMRAAEGLSLIVETKIKMVHFYEQHGRFPVNNQEAGLPAAENITAQAVKSVQIIRNGIIIITYNKNLGDNRQLLAIATAVKNADGLPEIRWWCGTGQDKDLYVAHGYLPANCREYIY